MTGRSLGWILVVGLLVGVPFGILIGFLLAEERLDGLTHTPVPLVESAPLVEFDERTGVAASLSWTIGPALYAPSWSGTVGHVFLEAGRSVRSGDFVAVVDGVTRSAVHSPQPFFRRLTIGDGGSDVVWLHDALAAFGHLRDEPNDPTRVGSSTISAINGLATEIGVIGPVDAFDPAWLVWLPEETFEVISVALIAGAPAPSGGTPIASGSPQLTEMSLRRLEGGPLGLEAGVDYLLTIEGTEVPLDPDTASVDSDNLVRLSDVLQPLVDSVSGSVRRAEPLMVWALPAAAVMSGTGGDLCVWVASGSGYEALDVEVISGRAGLTFVLPATPRADVLHNPADIIAEPTCPSR